MNILDFPAEILHKILFYAILTRRLKRGLRLKLVCKRFSDAVQPALFDTRILDTFRHLMYDGTWDFGIGDNWIINNQHGAEKLWHSYFVYRVQNETDDNAGRLLEVHRVAQLISAETGSLLLPTIETLCWLGLKYSFPVVPKSEIWKLHGMESGKPDLNLNLLAAATRFNLLPLVQTLLKKGVCPAGHNYLFPSPMEVAAQEGNAALLEIFQEHMDTEELPVSREWKGKTTPGVISAAALRGDMAILKLALYPPSRTEPDSTDVVGEKHGMINRHSKIGNAIIIAQKNTRSPDVHAYLEGFFNEPKSDHDMAYQLINHAAWGNLAMVQYILDRGASVHGFAAKEMRRVTPLGVACRRCHDDVVNLLLMRGADPNFEAHIIHRTTALPMAASAGSLEMTRKLLDHGAQVNEQVNTIYRIPALWYAVATEHTALLELLLSRGASFDACLDGYEGLGVWDGWIGQNALEMAEDLGLDSMAEILLGRGIRVIERIAHSGNAPWKKWSLNNNPQKSCCLLQNSVRNE